MRSTSSVVVLALLATPALSAPVSNQERGIFSSGANAAAGGLVSFGTNTVLSGLLNKIEGLFRRGEELAFDKRESAALAALSPEEKEQVKTALINKLKTYPGVQARGLFSSKPAAGGASSGSGTGSAIAGGLAAGAGGAIVNNIISGIEGLFSRDELAELHARGLFSSKPSTGGASSGTGSAIAGGLAAGAGGAIFNNIISGIEGLFSRESNGLSERDAAAIESLSSEEKAQVKTALINKLKTYPGVQARGLFSSKPAAGGASSSSGTGSAIAGGLAAGAGGAIFNNIISGIEGLFSRDELVELHARGLFSSKPSTGASSGSGTGSAIAGGLAAGAGGAIFNNIISGVEGLFSRDELAELHARGLFSSKPSTGAASSGTGSAIAGGLASGAGGAIFNNIISGIEGLFSRDLNDLSERDAAALASLSLDEKTQVKTALINKLKTYPGVQARSINDLD